MKHIGWLIGYLVASAGLLVAPAVGQESFSKLFDLAISQERRGLASDQLRPAFAASLRAFLDLPEEDPQYSAWLPKAGRAALGAGRITLACQFLEEARLQGEIDPFVVTWWLRAQLAAGAADAALRRAREWDPEYSEVIGVFLAGADGTGQFALLAAAGRAQRRGEGALGLWVFERIAAGGHPIAIANLALAQRHSGRTEASEHSYRLALDLTPDDALLWNDFGLFLKGIGRISEAWDAFGTSYRLEAEKGMGPATTNLLLLSRNGRRKWPEAGPALQNLLRLRPDAALARRLAIDRILGQD